MSSIAYRALRGACAVVAAAGLSACALHEGFPRPEVKSVGLAVTCGDTLRRDYYDLAYPANSNHASEPIPDWGLTDIARERVKTALPEAQIGELGVDPLKLMMIEMMRRTSSNFETRDYTRAFIGDAKQYDFLIAIVPAATGNRLAPYTGVGVHSHRGGTLFGTIDSKVKPLEAHAICEGIIYDRRSGNARHAVKVAAEPLSADIPPATALDYYPPETVAGFREPLSRLVRQTVDQIMPELVATPKPGK